MSKAKENNVIICVPATRKSHRGRAEVQNSALLMHSAKPVCIM